jgi:thiol-disulfide isomerase/thioredoxin
MENPIRYILITTFIIGILFASADAQDNNQKKVTTPEIRVVDFAGLQPLLEKSNDTTYVVNFWATWCAPCIKELPYFQRIHEKYTDKKVKVFLVSLDFERQIETRLKPFIEKNKLTPEVIVLNDPKSNIWIDKIDPTWSGAIPATLFFNSSNRLFFEKEFTYNEIEAILKQLNPQYN